MLLRSWIPLLLVVFLLGAFTRQIWPIAFALAVAVVLAFTEFWRKQSLRGVTYQRRWTYRRGFPGESIPVRIETENRKLLPLTWLKVIDPWPLAVGPTDESILGPSHIETLGELVNLYSLRWYEKNTRTYDLLLRQRGVYPIGPAQLTSGDLFGLYESTQEQKDQDLVVVFPDLVELPRLLLLAEDPFGDRRTRRRLFEDPNQPMGVRDYHPEDDFRRVHWPATAKTGALQVKVYQPVTARVMLICLNVSTSVQYWLGIDSDMLEQLVKVAATLAYHGVQNGYSVGLMSNGCLAHSDQPFRIDPGRSSEQLSSLLQALAAVTSFTSAPFETYLVNSMPKVPYGATLVIVTSLVTPELVESLASLKRYRSHTALISLEAKAPPEIPGVRIFHLPFEPA